MLFFYESALDLVLENVDYTSGYCIRLTSLPGACEISHLNQISPKNDEYEVQGLFKNTCNISSENLNGWHVELNCSSLNAPNHCFDRSGTGENFEIVAMNTHDALTGKENYIKGTGNWTVGAGLCDKYFSQL